MLFFESIKERGAKGGPGGIHLYEHRHHQNCREKGTQEIFWRPLPQINATSKANDHGGVDDRNGEIAKNRVLMLFHPTA